MINLYDAFGREENGSICDWGLSIYTEFRSSKILFDSGASALIFKKNAKAFDVDLTKIEIGVLSHNHWDHSTGLSHLAEVNPKVKLYMPNDSALGGGEERERNKKYKIAYRYPTIETDFVETSKKIKEGIHLIATTSVLTGEFWKYPNSDAFPEREIGLPEASLALEDENGSITLLVGCSHSGIENILKESKAYFNRGIDKVVGGLHLGPYDATYIENLIYQMQNEFGVKTIAASHCTGDLAQEMLKKAFGENYRAFGLGGEI